MKTRGPIGIILLFIILLGVFTFSCCVQNTVSQQQCSSRRDSGLKEVSGIRGVYPVNLEQALESMHTAKDSAGHNLSEYSIHYIQGDKVNMNGAAFHWMIGLKKGAIKVFYNYNSEGSAIVPWSAWFPQDIIDLNQIMMPSCLISSEPRIGSFFTNQEYLKSIVVVKSTYTVNVERNGIISSHEFNALKTGPCPTIIMII